MAYRNKDISDNSKIETKLIRSGVVRSNLGETSEALYLNSGFCYNDAETAESRFSGEAPGFVYSRYTNPNLKILESKLVALEKGAEDCTAVASGMAAVFSTIMCQIKSGDHVIASRVLFGSCYHIMANILPNYGIEVDFIDATKNSNWDKAFKKNTKIVFIETPANPNLELIDIEYVANVTKKNNAFLIVDNIFATPLGQSPIELGADAVVYSTTKHLDGQGRTLGGAVLGKSEFINETLLPFHRHTGAALSPFNAWMISKSLEVFSLRYKLHCSNAGEVAKFLESHSKVEQVIYPGLESHPQFFLAQKQMKSGGGLVAFKVKGGKEESFKFMNSLRIIDISNNLGDAKTLITHPATTTHSNMDEVTQKDLGITENLMRVSVGLENIDDLLNDLDSSLANL